MAGERDPTAPPPAAAHVSQPILAGVVTATVGFAGSFAIVLAGLHSVGADSGQAASGLLVLSVAMGVLGIALSLRTRMPLTIAWSTPGAALLVSEGVPAGGYAAALGAFMVCGALIVLAGAWAPLRRLITAIPTPLAAAMLAGVLLPVCTAPVRAAVEIPWQALPVILTWAILMRVARRWAVPGALAAAALAVLLGPTRAVAGAVDLAPSLTFTSPTFDLAALAGLALPLFIVTMTSQNVTGMAVLATFGYRPSLRPILLSTGVGTMLAAPFGGHALNLAAISAALSAGPEAGPDPGRRWIAAVTAAGFYILFGLGAGLATAGLAASPPILVGTVAGLALLGALGAALRAATDSEPERDAALVTFVVSASGITAASLPSPFWGLVAGLAFLGLQRVGRGTR